MCIRDTASSSLCRSYKSCQTFWGIYNAFLDTHMPPYIPYAHSSSLPKSPCAGVHLLYISRSIAHHCPAPPQTSDTSAVIAFCLVKLSKPSVPSSAQHKAQNMALITVTHNKNDMLLVGKGKAHAGIGAVLCAHGHHCVSWGCRNWAGRVIQMTSMQMRTLRLSWLQLHDDKHYSSTWISQHKDVTWSHHDMWH